MINKKITTEGIGQIGGHGGFDNLYRALFHGSWAPVTAGFPIILLGGWKNDEYYDCEHHIQRIVLPMPPALDANNILFDCAFPLIHQVALGLRGFITADGSFCEWNGVNITDGSGHKINYEWPVEYPGSELEIFVQYHSAGERRLERFDFICAAWLSDGRIYALKKELVPHLVHLARSTAIHSHEGGGPWRTLTEWRARQETARKMGASVDPKNDPVIRTPFE